MGKLDPEELLLMMHGVNSGPRMAHVPAGPARQEQAAQEAARCLQCGCLKADDCALRKCATHYNVHAARYRGERREFERDLSHHELIYERGKCITCGKCIQVAAAAHEKLGLTFLGRGFSMRVGVPFHRPLAEGLTHAAKRAAAECPTAALALKPPPA
jgi:NADH dehydrogenase/NADH:ubiquinone oxidoreductase subunit G